uniref:Uncharacterized protein n=1 Tax=Solanum tuberosum TaxID=4113 RepID=M1DYS8_SOLTU
MLVLGGSERRVELALATLRKSLLDYVEVNMSEEEMKTSEAGHRDGIDDINSIYNPAQSGGMGAICIPKINENVMFKVTSTTLHLLEMSGPY